MTPLQKKAKMILGVIERRIDASPTMRGFWKYDIEVLQSILDGATVTRQELVNMNERVRNNMVTLKQYFI